MRAQNDLAISKKSNNMNPYKDSFLNNSYELPTRSHSVEKDKRALEVIQRKMHKLDERHQNLKAMIFKKQKAEIALKKHVKLQS